jgi:hypothetical protein
MSAPRNRLSRRSDLSTENITIFEKNEIETKSCLPQLAKVAVGILTWPIAQLVKPQRFKGHLIRKVLSEDQKTTAMEWEVTPALDLGMPTMLSVRLLFAFCKLATEHKKQTGTRIESMPLPSWNQLCQLVGIEASHGNRVLLQRHAEILHRTIIRSKCAFRTKSGAQGISDVFSLVPSVRYKGQLDEDGKPYVLTWISLAKPLLDSIDNDYVKTIDLGFMAALDNETAQLLYTKVSYLLHKALKEGRNYEDFDYEWLTESMGLTVWKEKFHAKEQLKPAFDALVKAEYIEKPDWWVEGSWKIRIRPGVRFEFGEHLQLKIRKAAVRKSKAQSQQLIIPMSQPTPDDERQTLLLRMAMRINTGRKADVDVAALESHGWTIADAERKAVDLKPVKK